MAWTLYTVATTKKSELEAALRDDQVSRQSQKVREASALGGPSGSLYVLVEGAAEAVQRADSLLAPIGTKIPPAESKALYEKFRAEDEAASAGMGLFFTD